MIPLILLAIGLGAALTVYEFSPKTRSRVDAYVQALRSANAAHQMAEAHLATASRHAQQAGITMPIARPQPRPQPQPSPPPPAFIPPSAPTPEPAPVVPMPLPPSFETPQPSFETTPAPSFEPAQAEVTPPPVATNVQQTAADTAVDHVAVATEANQAAAQNTAAAAQNAQTEAEKQAAADSAAKVIDREQQIAAALRSLGVGQCGVRSYSRVSERVKNTLLARLRSEGMGVAGSNPWNIETNQYDVRLRAVWDPRVNVVKLIVTSGKGGYLGLVTCDEIWKKIDPIMKSVIG